MKKIMILAIVAAAASSIGCAGCGPRTSWFRGDTCDNCGTYEGTPNYTGYSADNMGGYPAYNNGVVVPPLPALPGPANE